jgi:uncharacterized protein
MKCALGLLTVELHFENSHSLKERRSVLNSLKTRIRQHFNVSVTEANFEEAWQRGGFLISCAASQANAIDQTFREIMSLLEREVRALILGSSVKYYE